ncbi:MAG: phosphoribosylamine--glycine ligase [Dehalococcoidales bacterium]|jgi:phosphoribosylamine--glycine ligase|nr:phosphoribosylamine--glycine ligase [Dehalococcoidales bacterium]
MNVFIVGGGAREHTIAWKLSLSADVKNLYVAPGNAGTAQIAENIPIEAGDIEGLLKSISEHDIQLVVVGPEIPLSKGLVDRLQEKGMAVFGPSKAAAQIEASKAFSKDFMARHKIPAAKSQTFTLYEDAKKHIDAASFPLVLKADGLSQGKGVIIAGTSDEAESALESIMVKKAFGSAGDAVIIEEFLSGRELSAFAFTDSRFTSPLVTACDYKRIYDGNIGPNTGGMGSYSPPEFYTPALGGEISATIMQPVIKYLNEENRPYKGVLYGGLMLTGHGPKVLEFNARFGDPETQVILPRLENDLLDVMLAISGNRLEQLQLKWSAKSCVGVVMASGGYPGSYQTGYTVTGLDDVDQDILVFHAGTKLNGQGEVVTSGGRVLTVVATGSSIEEARMKVYSNIGRISFKDCYYRKDIALLREI